MPAWLAASATLVAALAYGLAGPPLSSAALASLKAATAGIGAALLALRLWARRRPGARPRGDAALAALGALGLACGFNLLQFGPGGFGHGSETFHYFLGPKYFAELRYTRLYVCVAVADAEAGLGDRVGRRYFRDLETNRVERAASLLADPARCKRHFTPERWQAFRRDVAWLRNEASPRSWSRYQVDHGYNATPVWNLLGAQLAGRVAAGDASILALRLVDPLLLVLAWGCVGHAFGWRLLCVALLFWGTNYPAQFGWVGGGVLRQLELAAVLFALACLRRHRPVAAGFLLGLAGLVRVYPVLLLAGPCLQAAGAAWRARRPRLSPTGRGLALGVLLAVALLVPAASLEAGGLGVWREFAANSRLHLRTPLRNHMGLRTLVAHTPARALADAPEASELDPFARWKRGRQQAFAERRWIFWALVAAYAVLLARAVQREPPWGATILAVGLVPMATELTCYYSAVLAAFGLLAGRHPAIAPALLALSLAGWGLADVFGVFEAIFPWISLATALFVVFATLCALWARPVPDPDLARVDPPGS